MRDGKLKRSEREMEKMVPEEEIVIVGGGIAGLATAVALQRVGIRALVLERSDGLRATGAALGLFPNAWRALDALGVAHKLTAVYAVRKKYDFYSFIFLLFQYTNSRHSNYFVNKKIIPAGVYVLLLSFFFFDTEFYH